MEAEVHPSVKRRSAVGRSMAPARVETLESRTLFAVTIQFDYSMDTQGFFDDPARRTVLQAAAESVTARLADTLNAVTPGGSNTWSIVGTNPSNGQMFNLANRSIASDTIVVFVGGYDLPGSTLGLGGPTGWSGSGSSSWLTNLRTRGETGAGTTPRTDFAPMAGSIAFDSMTSWYYGSTTTGLTNSAYDFFSVAAHELGHVLGVGTSDSWTNLTMTGSFTGAASSALYGGAVPLDSSRSHWADGAMTGPEESALDPTIARGVRKLFTTLDFAALDDIGWEVTPSSAVASVSIIDAGTNSVAGTLANGSTINLAAYPNGISLRANVTGNVGSVRFMVNGVLVRTENATPYSIAGENGSDIFPWDVTNGTYTLVTTPFSGPNGTGQAGTAKSISFTVTGIVPQGTPATSTATARVNATDAPVRLVDGRVFVPASGFMGGTQSVTPFAVANTVDDMLYSTRRWGSDFSFARNLPDGTYTVRLHLAEPSHTTRGKRTFDVFAEGTKVLADFDIVANAGAKAAMTRDINVTIADGQLNLRFVGKIDNAIISGITIAPRLEAETATRSGATVMTNHAGYTGTGFTDFNGAAGEYVEWSTTATDSGAFTLSFRYTNGGTVARTLALQVNGVVINPALSFAPTGSWSTWKTVEVTLNLNPGDNTIRLTTLNGLSPNLDSLLVA